MLTNELEQQEQIFTVSRLNSEAKFILEDTFPHVWVEGEISNFAAPGSGHWYFSLKDTKAQVRCCLFKGNQRKLGFTAKDGMHVLIKARVSLYEARGEFQLIAEFMEERGEGKLQRAFEALKKKLAAAGLFAEEHKKPIPCYPKQIGVITSATGAAIRDILTVLQRRYPCVPVIIYPTLVQGSTAAPTIVSAIEIANRRNECDVLILARGGGSLEDLWPFNEEIVAHAIFKSIIPIISGVGHEVDFTIADFVADRRAPTPSVAAEFATPDKNEIIQVIERYQQQLFGLLKNKFSFAIQQLSWMQKNLSQQHPKRKLLEKMQQLDFLEVSLVQLQQRLFAKLQKKISDANEKLYRENPQSQVKHIQHLLVAYQHQLANLILTAFNQKQTMLANLAGKLDALSPLATLNRGYAIVTTKNAQVVYDTTEIRKGDQINVKLKAGILECLVEKVS